ncbi:MAG: L-lactate dehydrogenase [Clostridium sp.]|nr:L-lactate dehydrogenase [Clostridium sp.]MCM1546822.1 L-lactate dehydrogenase [Ruminococcus sp.]
MNKQKCAVIGCGAVGATIAFALTQKSLFSELVLIDANHAKAEGEAMDLSHGLPFAHPMKVYAGGYEDISDCYLIIITAGAAQKPNETRLDIVHKNVEIFKSIIPQITKYNHEAIILVVSNPVDILTYCTIKLSGFPPEKVLGSGTVLDTARLKYRMGRALCVDSRSIHAFIIGEHGDSELAVWSSANVSGIDLEDFHGLCSDCRNISFNDIYQSVRDSAYEVIERKGATYYGIAMAVTKIVLSIIRDEHSVLPVSGYIDGHYGLNDVCIGVPSIVGSGGIEKILDIPLSNDENEQLMNSVKTLKSVISELNI